MKIKILGFFTVIQIILFSFHYLIYRSFVEFFSVSGSSQLLTTRIAFVVLSLSFTVASALASKYYGRTVRILYTAAAVWLGTAYWLLLASVATWVLYGVAALLAPSANTVTAVPIIGMALMLAAVLVSAYGVWNSFQIKIRTVPVALENLPEQWRGRRAVVAADMHFGAIRNASTAKKIAVKISALKPDVVFICGDFYDGTPLDFDSVAQPFGEVRAKFGTFFAAGNHEEYGDKSVCLAALRKAGVRVLANEAVDVDGLRVAGVDYEDAAKPEDEARILASLNLDPASANVLINHAPGNVAVAEQAGVSLQLSGHTHVGQMWPLGYIAYAIFGKFYRGLNTLNRMQVYTTSGVGTWGPPQRVGTSAEVAVITF